MKMYSKYQCRTLLLLVLNSGLASAQIQWQFEADGRIIGKPTVTESTIYVAAGNTLHAISRDGKQLWQRELAGDVAASVAVEADTVYVHSSAALQALDKQGEQKWLYANDDQGPLVDGRTWGWGNEILADPWGWYRSAPLIVDETVYFGSSDGVHAVSKQTGEALWHVAVGPVTADLVPYEDTIIVASWNNSIYSLNAKTGKLRWRLQARVPSSKTVDWVGYSGFNLTPVLQGERIFVGSRGTYFYSIDANDGSEVWSSKVGSSWIGSPAVVSDDAVYFGLSDGTAVLGYDQGGGKQNLFFNTGSLVFAQPALYGEQLIVGSLSGHLFSIDTTSGQGKRLMSLGPEEIKYAEFFEAENVPEGLTRYQASNWSIDRMLTQANGILNLEVDRDTAYIGTGSGVLYAVNLASLD